MDVTHISDNLLSKTLHTAALSNFSLKTFMPNLAASLIHRSLQILDKNQTGVFLISGFLIKFFLNKNCHNSRTTNDIDISKLGLVTKLNKRNTITLKNTRDDVVSTNYDVIVTFPNYDRFQAIWKPDNRGMGYNSYILVKRNFQYYKI